MLEQFAESIKTVANYTFTNKGSLCHKSTFNRCLTLFAQINAWRNESEHTILECFLEAYVENPTMALQILFFARDIRNGLGERRVFRLIIQFLAAQDSASLAKNIQYIPEYGRWDDLLNLIDQDAIAPQVTEIIKQHLSQCQNNNPVSRLAKWLPFNGASRKSGAVRVKNVARRLGLTNAEMEFDYCSNTTQTAFEHAKEAFQHHGYRLPNLIFWNVAARHSHQPAVNTPRVRFARLHVKYTRAISSILLKYLALAVLPFFTRGRHGSEYFEKNAPWASGVYRTSIRKLPVR